MIQGEASSLVNFVSILPYSSQDATCVYQNGENAFLAQKTCSLPSLLPSLFT